MGNSPSLQEILNNNAFESEALPNPGHQSQEQPQQNVFQFEDITFDSRFEGGNLMYANKFAHDHYNLWIAPDCFKTEYETKKRVAFYFNASNINFFGYPTRVVNFTIKNMDKLEYDNYVNGM